jgi:hypothetical protein
VVCLQWFVCYLYKLAFKLLRTSTEYLGALVGHWRLARRLPWRRSTSARRESAVKSAGRRRSDGPVIRSCRVRFEPRRQQNAGHVTLSSK